MSCYQLSGEVTMDRAAPSAAPRCPGMPDLMTEIRHVGGFYGDDLLDNLAHPSAITIIPEFQHLEVGQLVPMSPPGRTSERTAFSVHSFRVNEWLLWSKPDSTWAWSLTPT